MKSDPVPDGMIRSMVRKRLDDYEDIEKQKARLLEAWRQAYPDAANETSAAAKPLLLMSKRVPGDQPDDPDEHWANDTYFVTLRRHAKDPVFGTGGGMIQLGINAIDGTARHDWREFQAIKNQLAGPECEAFELYPAESRLIDPSNYYALWCFPGLKRLRVGREERRVLDADQAFSPQRAFPPEPS